MLKKYFLFICLSFAGLNLMGCGQTGPLYLTPELEQKQAEKQEKQQAETQTERQKQYDEYQRQQQRKQQEN